MSRLALYICFILLAPLGVQAATLNCSQILAGLRGGEEAELKKAISIVLSNLKEADLKHMQNQLSDPEVVVPYPKAGSFDADNSAQVLAAIEQAVKLGQLEAEPVRKLIQDELAQALSKNVAKKKQRSVVKRKRRKVPSFFITLKRQHLGQPASIKINPANENEIIAVHNNGVIYVWDRKTGQIVREFEDGFYSVEDESVVISPDGKQLATYDKEKGHVNLWGKEKGHVNLWDVESGKFIKQDRRARKFKDILTVYFSPEGDLKVIQITEKINPLVRFRAWYRRKQMHVKDTIYIRDYKTFRLEHKLKVKVKPGERPRMDNSPREIIHAPVLSEDNKTLFWIVSDNYSAPSDLAFWKIGEPTYDDVPKNSARRWELIDTEIFEDGDQMAITEPNSVTFINRLTGEERKHDTRRKMEFTMAVLSPDKKWLVVGEDESRYSRQGISSSFVVFDFQKGEIMKTINVGMHSSLGQPQFLSDSKHFIIFTENETLLMNLETGAPVLKFPPSTPSSGYGSGLSRLLPEDDLLFLSTHTTNYLYDLKAYLKEIQIPEAEGL